MNNTAYAYAADLSDRSGAMHARRKMVFIFYFFLLHSLLGNVSHSFGPLDRYRVCNVFVLSPGTLVRTRGTVERGRGPFFRYANGDRSLAADTIPCGARPYRGIIARSLARRAFLVAVSVYRYFYGHRYRFARNPWRTENRTRDEKRSRHVVQYCSLPRLGRNVWKFGRRQVTQNTKKTLVKNITN